MILKKETGSRKEHLQSSREQDAGHPADPAEQPQAGQDDGPQHYLPPRDAANHAVVNVTRLL
jgi:hypothetical protein